MILCIDCINYKAGATAKSDMCAHYAEFEMVRGEPNIIDWCLQERSPTGRCRPQGLNFKAAKPVSVDKRKVLTLNKK
jgi:hypothetical protein